MPYTEVAEALGKPSVAAAHMRSVERWRALPRRCPMTDGPDDPDLLSVAASISAGAHVEWNRLQQKTPTTDDPDLLRDLRVIDEIARFHRTWGRADNAPNPAT